MDISLVTLALINYLTRGVSFNASLTSIHGSPIGLATTPGIRALRVTCEAYNIFITRPS